MVMLYIFTKDRPCQVDLLLHSLEKNLPGVFSPYILWKASSVSFRRGYELLQRLHPAADYIEETHGPRGDLLTACEVAQQRCGLIGIATDDCVVWRPTRIRPRTISDILGIEQILCVSLRYGVNTVVQDYTIGSEQPPLSSASPVGLAVGDGENWQMWKYRSFEYYLNYGYPMGMDFHVFRAHQVRDWTESLAGMKTYRDWEGALHLPRHRDEFARLQPWVASPERSCVVNIPANSVQVDPTLSGTRHHYGLDFLNEQFLQGKRIDLEVFDFSDVKSCHYEYPLVLK